MLLALLLLGGDRLAFGRGLYQRSLLLPPNLTLLLLVTSRLDTLTANHCNLSSLRFRDWISFKGCWCSPRVGCGSCLQRSEPASSGLGPPQVCLVALGSSGPWKALAREISSLVLTLTKPLLKLMSVRERGWGEGLQRLWGKRHRCEGRGAPSIQ